MIKSKLLRLFDVFFLANYNMESKMPPHNKRANSALGSIFSGNTGFKSVDDNNLLVQDDNVQGDSHI